MGVVRQIAIFVKRQQGRASAEAQPAAQAGGIAIQIGKQIGRGAEEKREDGGGGGVGHISGKYGFAQTVTSAQDEITVASCGMKQSKVRARSIKGRSIFFGHCPSKSARGMKRPRRARSRGRARILLRVLSDGEGFTGPATVEPAGKGRFC
jgi:hypothetical protein